MRKKILTLGVVFFLVACQAVAQGRGSIPDDVPNAARIRDYVVAFNAGEAAMAKYFADNVADAALQQRSVADRVEIYKQMRDRLQSLEVVEVTNVQISGAEQSVTTLVKTGSGQLALTFYFDPQPPNKLLFLRIEDAGSGPAAPEGKAVAPLTKAEFVKKVSAYLDALAAKDEFSGVVLVARKGQSILQKAYGQADKDKKIANNMETKFNLGSINKVFTRLAIDRLVTEGKLSYDDKLGKFLPDYPNRDAAQKVSIRQLLTMRSGIGDFFGEKFEAAPKAKITTLADYLPFFADQPLLFEPGTQQRYSNGGYIVLGLIVEKLSGKTYYDYVRENIFRPAGMKDTDSFLTSERVANRAEGYTTLGAGKSRTNNASTRPARGSSAGGGYSTAPDLLRFTQAIAAGKLAMNSPETGKSVLTGLGIAGGSPGVNGAIEFDPKSGDSIIVLGNYDPPSAEKAAQQIRLWLRAVKD